MPSQLTPKKYRRFQGVLQGDGVNLVSETGPPGFRATGMGQEVSDVFFLGLQLATRHVLKPMKIT